jgi:hypothetical protein
VAVNVVGTFLVALQLMPALRATSQRHNVVPTLVVVSSEVHFFTAFPERAAPDLFAALDRPADARMADRYNVSKLLEVLVVREWGRGGGLCGTRMSRSIW